MESTAACISIGALAVAGGHDEDWSRLQESCRTELRPVHAEVVQAGAYFLEYAEAAYQANSRRVTSAAGASTLPDVRHAAQDWLHKSGLRYDTEVKHAGELTDMRQRAFLVAVDAAMECVVLAIRGTASDASDNCDIRTDLRAAPTSFCGGRAHRGIAACVEPMWSAAGGTVLRLLRAHPRFGLVLVGHSLGGGVAALLAIWLQASRTLPEGVAVSTYTYGAPPVYAPLEQPRGALLTVYHNTWSFVNGLDLVPRLQASAEQVFWALAGHGARAPASGSAAGDAAAQEALVVAAGRDAPMQVPGTFLWMVGDKCGELPASCDRARSLIIHQDMTRHHTLASYRLAFAADQNRRTAAAQAVRNGAAPVFVRRPSGKTTMLK